MNQAMQESGTAESGKRFDIVALASSAGGIRALAKVLGDLPEHFRVPVLVVQHLDPRHQTVITEVLGRRTSLPVRLARISDQAEAGTVYIAPPDHHLLIGSDGEMTLSHSELVHFV